MSFENMMSELRRQKPFDIDEILDICKVLSNHENTAKYVKQIWLACQLSNSLGFSIATINEFQNQSVTFTDENPFYAVCVSWGQNSYCFSVPEDATIEYVALQAMERVLKSTGTWIEQPELRFWNEALFPFPIQEGEEMGERKGEDRQVQFVRDLEGAYLNASEDFLRFEIFDASKENSDIAFCNILWDFAQVTVKMKAEDTIYDMLCEAQDMIERKLDDKYEASSVKNQVYYLSNKTPLDSNEAPVDPNATIESLLPEFDHRMPTGFREIALVVKSDSFVSTAVPAVPEVENLNSSGIKDGYYVHCLWDKCQIDFKVYLGANLIDTLRKARDLIEERRKLNFILEDAWDHVFYEGKHIEDTRTLVSALPNATPNDSTKPVHLAIDLSSQIGKATTPRLNVEIKDVEIEPMYYCHVFWHKSFISVHMPKSSTCIDLLEDAQKILECTKQLEDLDIDNAMNHLTYQGYNIKEATCRLEELPGAASLQELHFAVEEPTPESKEDLCFFCSLMWREDGSAGAEKKEFMAFKLPPDAVCYDIFEKLKEKRRDFDIERDGVDFLWLNHELLVSNPKTTRVADLAGAQLCSITHTDFSDSSKSLHFLIDAHKKEAEQMEIDFAPEFVPHVPEMVEEEEEVVETAGEEAGEDLELYKPNQFIDEFDEPAQTVSVRSASSNSRDVKDPDLTADEMDRLSQIMVKRTPGETIAVHTTGALRKTQGRR